MSTMELTTMKAGTMELTTVEPTAIESAMVETSISDVYLEQEAKTWVRVAPSSAFPENGGACVKVGALQIAVFNFTRRGEWYACQNSCPHRMEMILSRGMLGSTSSVPKVACPYHKSTFSLETGECLNADLSSIETYPVRVENGDVFIRLFQSRS